MAERSRRVKTANPDPAAAGNQGREPEPMRSDAGRPQPPPDCNEFGRQFKGKGEPSIPGPILGQLSGEAEQDCGVAASQEDPRSWDYRAAGIIM
jgi:hypothetical protein